MKRILTGLLSLLACCGLAHAQQAGNTWSTQDYTFYAGDFNGDGLTDILYIAHSPNRPSGILLSDGTSPTIVGQTWASNYLGIPWSSDAYIVLVGDFNGDGKADVFLQASGPGDSYLLLNDGAGHINAISQTIPEQAMGLDWSADEHHLAVGDFNGDEHADLFFQPTVPGGVSAVVYADANGQFTSVTPAQSWEDGYLGLNWSVQEAKVYAGDFNGDGLADLLIQAQPSNTGDANESTAFTYPPNMNGVVLAQAAAAQPFQLAGLQSWSRNAFGVDWSPIINTLVIADFNGDGRADVLLQPIASGGATSLVFGQAAGPIFTSASASIASDVPISGGAATLIAGNFAGAGGAGLLIQSASQQASNAIAKNIPAGIHSKGMIYPVLSASSVQIAPIAYPSGASPQSSAPAPSGAATLTPSSAGRTAAQFSVTPTGAASYNIPLWTPPGARGVEPHLALHYTSGGPDGPMGPGWSLMGTSAIARCGKTWVSTNGVPAGVNLTTADDICLDGNRLILTSGSPLQAGAVYQTEIADFSNITAYGTQGNGPQYFIVQGKDGKYYEYGNSADSRIFGSGATTPYAWVLNKVRDRQQNNMVLTYTGASAPTLSSIQYTATPGTSFAAPYQVSFTYGPRPSSGTTTLTKYVAGYPVTQPNLLSSINVTSSGTSVRQYLLTYTQSWTTLRPLLTAVQECGGPSGGDCLRPTTINYQGVPNPGTAGWSSTAVSTGLTGQYGFIPIDLNGDGIPDALYGKSSGTNNIHWYARIATISGYGSEMDTGANTPTNTSPTQNPIIGAFSGTGKQQFLAPVNGTWYVYALNSAGNGFSTPASTGVTVNGEYTAVDYDGDGLPDLVSISGTSVYVRRNTTAPGGVVAFATSASNVYNTGSTTAQGLWSNPVTPDFNGDGRADFIVTEEQCDPKGGCVWPTQVLLSNGFGSAATVLSMGNTGGRNWGAVPGDVNGDGCTDLIAPTGLFISDCHGNLTFVSSPIPKDSSGNYVAMQAVDWDGDGQTDRLYADPTTNIWYVQRSTGSALAAAVSTGIPAPTSKSFFVSDRNADGQPEVMYVDSANAYAVGYYPHNGVNAPPDLATSISDGFGITFSPTYTPIDQYNYSKYTDAIFPEIDFQGPMYVVNQFSASDGTGGTYTNDFYYYGARLHLQGRGFEGFYAARQHDSRNGTYVFSYYQRQFPYTGMLFEQDTVDSTQTYYLASIKNTNPASKTPGGLNGSSCSKCYFPYFGTSTVYAYEPTGSKAQTGFNAYISQKSTVFSYDSYGNLTDTKTTTTDTDSRAPASPFNGLSWITEIANPSIVNDSSAANWCLGRPSTTTTTNTVPNQASQTRTVGHTIDAVMCRATVETVEPNDTKLKVTTSFGFDACGNTNSVSVVGLDQNGNAMPQRQTQTNYGTRCQLPELVTNPYSQSTQTAYRYDLGLPSSITDPNNIVTVAWQYDDFGRKTQETRADGTYTTHRYTDCVASSCWGLPDLRLLDSATLYNSAGTQVRSEYKYYDGLDRLRDDEGTRVLGVWDILGVYYYDSLGRRIQANLPYSSAGNGYHIYSYDLVNRLTRDQLYTPAGAVYRTVTIDYEGQTTNINAPTGANPLCNPACDTTQKVTDVAGKIRQVTDPSAHNTVAGTTKYTFDPFGNLITVLDANNVSSSYSYNIRGFKFAASDADTGSWTFTPDSLNELVSQKDAKLQVTTFGYDLMGRMTSRTEPESTTATQWTYGSSASSHNIGRLVQVTKPDGYAEGYTFDSIGRPQVVTYTEDGTNYPFTYAYNNLGTVDTLTYPVSTSGYQFVLKSVYDSAGFPNQVKDNATGGMVFWTLNAANDSSLPMAETLGNGVQIASTYTPQTNEITLRTEGSGGSTTNLQNLSYNWDAAGNLHQRIDNRQTLTEQFGYDSMNRLMSSTLNGNTNLTMTYDAAGDITLKSDVSPASYTYFDTAHKHAVTGAGSLTMTYDANGNMITRTGGSISWYSYNLPSTISGNGNSTQFFYNASHQRWKQVATYSGTTETTHYVGGLLEVMTRGSGPTEYRHQIPAGSNVAIYTRRTDGTSATYYATSDHLGSSDLVMDSAATVLTRESFTPFGARRGSNWQGVPTASDYTAFGNTTRKGFTGHEMLDSVGFVHMNGRVYDPFVGRVLSPDTVVQDLAATQSVNPYSYGWNDPLKYVDPSGHSLLGDILGVFASIAAIFFLQPEVFLGQGLLFSTALAAGFVGGFVGALVSTGSLSAALTAGFIGAVSAGAFYGAGSLVSSVGAEWKIPVGVLAHAVVGCWAAGASGGNCGKGAFAAGISEGAVEAGLVGSLSKWGSYGDRIVEGAVAAGAIGGAAARAIGGSFVDGFSVGAAGYLFNNLGHMLVGTDADQTLRNFLMSGPNGQRWTGNVANGGQFGGGRPDLLYRIDDSSDIYMGWEVKPAGQEGAASAQLQGYVTASGGTLVTGDNALIFSGGSSFSLRSTGFLSALGLGETYTYYSGPSGVVTYTSESQFQFQNVFSFYQGRSRKENPSSIITPFTPVSPVPGLVPAIP